MTKNTEDTEVVSVRLPKRLLARLTQWATSGNISQTVREVLERGMPPHSTDQADEMVRLQADTEAALQSLVTKMRTKQPLTRTEWAYLANTVQLGFAQMRPFYSHVRARLLEDNLRAFVAFLALRDEYYPTLNAHPGDGYYYSHLGATDRTAPLAAQVDETLQRIHGPYISVGYAESLSRNLLVALNQEPPVPQDRLNQVLGPALSGLVHAAQRLYVLRAGQPLAGSDQIQPPAPVSAHTQVGGVSVWMLLQKFSVSAGIGLDAHNLILSCDTALELEDLDLLFEIVDASWIDPAHRAGAFQCGKWGVVAAQGIDGMYDLVLPGCRIHLTKETRANLRAAIRAAQIHPDVQPILQAHMERYGSL